MGLLYPFPAREDPLDDRIEVASDQIILKTYGLPFIFWGYLAAILGTLALMFLAIQNPLVKLIQTQDIFNQALGLSVFALFALIPIALLFFFFYEKMIQKRGQSLTLLHKFFGVPCWKKTIPLKTSHSFQVVPVRGTPNLASQKQKTHLKAFQNRGHHQLLAEDSQGEWHFIDRHSSSNEMKKIQTLLST